MAAMKDPYSGNLDRIQIIKGWDGLDGDLHEKVYDVAWSDDRGAGSRRRQAAAPWATRSTWPTPPGPTPSALPSSSPFWTDPDFDPKERAFYYARVIEIPTPPLDGLRSLALPEPRWTDKVPMTTQERAYTSPIWYTP